MPDIDKIDIEISHAVMVLSLIKPGYQICEELNPHQAHMIHMAMGISGEAGELLDQIKKSTIYQRELDRENIIEELGDLEFYMEGLRAMLGISRKDTLEHNMAKLARRYGEGFEYSNESAIARADKAELPVRESER